MKKGTTYWDVLKKSRRVLYKENSYWAGAMLVVVGTAMIFADYLRFTVGILLSLIGFFIVMYAKWEALNQEVKL